MFKRKTHSRICGAASLIAILGSAVSTASAKPTDPFHGNIRDSLGVNIHFTDPKPGEMKMLAASGLGWIRMDFAWDATEKQTGVYDFSHYDTLLENLKRKNMNALFILDYRNALYGPGGLPPFDESGRTAFARWAVAAVNHFQGQGVLWELWNEPNNAGFWHNPNAGDYAKLAITVDKAIRTAVPGETLIGPAVSGMDFAFLETCFKAGCLTYWDAVSVHPYRQDAPESASADYVRLADMIAKYAPVGRHIPILAAEWGYSTAWGGQSERRQADYVDREFLTNIENNIPLSIWYDWHDDGPDLTDSESNFGITHSEYYPAGTLVYVPKTAYNACKALAGILGDCKFVGRIKMADDSDHMLEFSRNGKMRYAAWTTSKTPHTVTLPLRPGKANVIDWLNTSEIDQTVGADGLIITLTQEPQFVEIPK